MFESKSMPHKTIDFLSYIPGPSCLARWAAFRFHRRLPRSRSRRKDFCLFEKHNRQHFCWETLLLRGAFFKNTKLFNKFSNYTSGRNFPRDGRFVFCFSFLFDPSVVRNYLSINARVPVLCAGAHFVSSVDCVSIAALCLDK